MFLYYVLFAAIFTALFTWEQLFLRQRARAVLTTEVLKQVKHSYIRYLPVIMTVFVIISLVGGCFFVNKQEEDAKNTIKNQLAGIGPTLAYELEQLGHFRLSTATPPNDRIYLEMIDRMINWIKLNPQIESIYTFRKTPDNNIIFILDPETDYNGNGIIDDEKEMRVPLGTIYPLRIHEIDEAFQGRLIFQDEPTTDKWGTTVSAYVPLYRPEGGPPEAIIGIDFDGQAWNEIIFHTFLQSIGLLLILLLLVNTSYIISYVAWVSNIRKNVYQQNLLIAKEAAEAASLAKSRFIANISHEVRTPLHTIFAINDLLVETNLSPYQKSLINNSRDAGTALLSVINDILDFSKAEAGKTTLEKVSFSLRTVANTAINLVSWRAREKKLLLTASIDPSIPDSLCGDPVRFRQIIINLLSNAVKFTEKGEVSLAFFLQSKSDNNVMIRCEVTDTGIGISQEAKSQIFEPFVQADSSTTRQYGGTGLGLAIARSFVDLMNGEIGILDNPGGGTIFWFTACFDYNVTCAPSTTSRKTDNEEHQSNNFEAKTYGDNLAVTSITDNARILLVDDNPANQKIMLLLLSKLGITSDVAANGQEAVQATLEKEYALILMDCQMPVMDGFAATTAIRKNEENEPNRRIPIIAMTANSQEEDRNSCLSAGMDAYLSKPVQLGLLKTTLEYWLDRKGKDHHDGL